MTLFEFLNHFSDILLQCYIDMSISLHFIFPTWLNLIFYLILMIFDLEHFNLRNLYYKNDYIIFSLLFLSLCYIILKTW